MIRTLTVFAVAGLLLTTPAQLNAQTSTADALALAPPSSMAVVIVNRLATTNTRIERLTRELLLPMPTPLTMLRALTGVGEGLDEQGSAAVLLLAADDQLPSPQPRVVVALPTSDYAKLIVPFQPDDAAAKISRGQINGRPLVFAKRGQFALFASADDLAALEQVVDAPQPKTKPVMPEWMASNELVAVTRPGALPALFSGITAGLQQAAKGVDNAGPAAAPVKVYFELLENLLISARMNLQEFAVTISLPEAGGIALAKRVAVQPGGDWSKVLDQPAGSVERLFAGLPAQPPFIVAFGTATNDLANQYAADFSVKMIESSVADVPGGAITDDQRQRLRTLYDEMLGKLGLLNMAMVMPVPELGQPIFSKSLTIVSVRSSADYLARQRKYTADFQKLLSEIKLAGMPPMIMRDTKIGGRDAIEIEMDLLATLKQQPGVDLVPAEAMFTRIFGPAGKMKMVYVALDEQRILSGFDRQVVEDYLRTPPTRTVTDLPTTRETTERLTRGAQTMSLVDLRAVMSFLNDSLAGFPGNPGVKLPEFPAAPPLGISIHSDAQGLQAEIFVPSETFAALGEFIAKLRALAPQKH